MTLSGAFMKKNCKIANTDTNKALFSEILLLEGNQFHFELAIGYFEIWKKNGLRHSSDIDFIF